MTEHQPTKKKGMSGIEKFVLIVVLLIVGYLLLKTFGVNLVEKTEEGGFIERTNEPTNEELKAFQEERTRERNRTQRETNQILSQLAQDFSEETTENIDQYEDITQEEADFFNALKNEYGDQIKKRTDWFSLLKMSYKTFDSVKDLVDGISGTSASNENLKAIKNDQYLTEKYYHLLEKEFKISKEKSDQFDRGTPKTLEEWVIFIDKNKR